MEEYRQGSDDSRARNSEAEEALREDEIAEDEGEVRQVIVPLRDGKTWYQINLPWSNENLVVSSDHANLNNGREIIVNTRFGRDMAKISGKISQEFSVPKSDIVHMERLANEADLEKKREFSLKEQEAVNLCKEKIKEHRLDMKLVAVHYLFDDSKIIFLFTAENRVDFRELVKDLVAIFKLRIELRQIGVRDEARVVGGLAVCGRAFCCHSISDKLKPVSIKMAKDQNLSLNSLKISGPCGRLLCCLSYEHGFYQEARRSMPSEGYRLFWNGMNWRTVEVNPVTSSIRLQGEEGQIINIPASSFERVDGRWQIKMDSENQKDRPANAANKI